ncbi:MAG: hypothetical protein CMO55_07720 [Verrucomicrobiales bacterium]|nr:hypothetical protein [Verrucomicrobiales bacterium]
MGSQTSLELFSNFGVNTLDADRLTVGKARMRDHLTDTDRSMPMRSWKIAPRGVGALRALAADGAASKDAAVMSNHDRRHVCLFPFALAG